MLNSAGSIKLPPVFCKLIRYEIDFALLESRVVKFRRAGSLITVFKIVSIFNAYKRDSAKRNGSLTETREV